MTRNEHLMTIAGEECAEIHQRLSKALRFGVDQVQKDADDKPEQNPELRTNRGRAMAEFRDLVAVLDMLGWLSTTEHYSMTLVAVYTADLDAKKAKVERYFQRSRDNGTLQEG